MKGGGTSIANDEFASLEAFEALIDVNCLMDRVALAWLEMRRTHDVLAADQQRTRRDALALRAALRTVIVIGGRAADALEHFALRLYSRVSIKRNPK